MKNNILFKIENYGPTCGYARMPKSGIYAYSGISRKPLFVIVSQDNYNKITVVTPCKVRIGYSMPSCSFYTLMQTGLPIDVTEIFRIGGCTVLYEQEGTQRVNISQIYKMLQMFDRADDSIFAKYKDMCNKLKVACNKDRKTELGVELELEHPEGRYAVGIAQEDMPSDLVHDVGTDGSVMGVEIRFNHPTVHKWARKTIDTYLEKLASKRFSIDKNTAGMHIHVSGKNIGRFIDLWENTSGVYGGENPERKLLEQILYPISDRPKNAWYGVGGNMLKLNSEFNTVEFRVWRATLDPWAFKMRIKMAKQLFEHVTDGKSLKTFFADMPKTLRSGYCKLVEKCKYHEWGDANIVNIARVGGTL